MQIFSSNLCERENIKSASYKAGSVDEIIRSIVLKKVREIPENLERHHIIYSQMLFSSLGEYVLENCTHI